MSNQPLKSKGILFSLPMFVRIAWLLIPAAMVHGQSIAPEHAPLWRAPGECLNDYEQLVVEEINAQREAAGLTPVPVSRSLTQVAQWHVWDYLTSNYYLVERSQGCNSHTWSAQRPDLWESVCYTPDHAEAEGMWHKPHQITQGLYDNYGYENSAVGQGVVGLIAVERWMASPNHRAVILNQGGWQRLTFQAMGVGSFLDESGVGATYLWFGESPDPAEAIPPCEATP